MQEDGKFYLKVNLWLSQAHSKDAQTSNHGRNLVNTNKNTFVQNIYECSNLLSHVIPVR